MKKPKRKKTEEEIAAEDRRILGLASGTGPHPTTFLSDPRSRTETVDREDVEILKLSKPR